MIGAFNTVYKAVQGLLSADFWSAVFAPIALFAALHAAILTRFGWHPDLDELFKDTGKYANRLLIVFAGLVLAGYILQAFLPLLRGLLDGSLLPVALHDWLRRGRVARARAQMAGIDSAQQAIGAWQTVCDAARNDHGKLQVAYQAALALPGAAHTASIAAAGHAVARLETALAKARLPTLAQAETAQALLVAALAVNNPGIDPPEPDAANSLRLDRIVGRLSTLLQDCVAEATYEYDILQTRNRVTAALKVPRATLLGDARYVVERYPVDVYNVNFDFLWPRLLMALRATDKDDPDIAAVETARSRIDFALLSLLLACSLPAVWFPAILLLRGEAWLVLAIGGATTVLAQVFYRMAVEAQLALADVIRTVIDRHRFIVLQMFSQPQPASRTDERQIWERIRMAEEDGRTADLTYVADPVPAPAPDPKPDGKS